MATPTTFDIGGDLSVNRIGFGAMRLTGQPGNFGPYADWKAGKAVLQRAVELGINLFDSAWAYGPEYADRILGEAISDRNVIFATKGGVDKPEPGRIVCDASPDTLRHQIEQARKNLNRECIDLFQLHRIDPETPLESSLETLLEAQSKNHIRHIGLSNVSLEEVERALTIAPIASVQNRFNMAETEDSELVTFTAERGIAYFPYGPLGAQPMEYGATLKPGEALAWLLEYSPNIIAIPGTTSISHLEENFAVWDKVKP